MSTSEVSPDKWQRLQQRIEELVTCGQVDAVDVLLTEDPSLRMSEALLIDCLYAEFCAREKQGHTASPDDYVRRFPEFNEPLRRLFELHEALDKQDLFATVVPPSAGSEISTDQYKTAEAESFSDRLSETTPISGSPSQSPVGRIGDYEILEEIARGGMGVVYKARHRQLGRIAAVKLIKSGLLADEAEVQRFQIEAQAAAELDHSGIVSVFEFGQQDGQHYMALAYIEGQSLWQRVKESPLPPQQAAKVMQQVAEAIQYAHDRGIIHRDLKPQNILLTKDGQPKITDFGLAKKQTGDSSLTGTGQVLGTPSYMPPEQVSGKKKTETIGPLADVYSLGATLYYLLTGRPPFQAATPIDTMLQVLNQEPLSPRQLNPAIPKDLETICLKCLQKDSAKRYASARELAQDLNRFQRGEPILARPVGPVERGWRWCRRNPVVSGLMAATAVLLVSVVTVFIVSVQREVRSLAISAYSTTLDNGLQLDDWTADHVRELEDVLEKLARVDPAKAETGRERVNTQFAADLDRRARQPRISDDDLAELNALLAMLSARDANLASPIQKLLDLRRSAWQPLVELQGNFAGWESVFDAQSVQRDGSRLLAIPPADLAAKAGDLFSAPRVMLLTESGPNVQCEVQWDVVGDDVADLGLEFNTQGESSYGFRVQQIGASQTTVEGLGRAQFTRPAQLQICRNGRVLRQTEIEGTKLFNQPVQLRAKRQGTSLSLQVNDAAPIDVEDPFPLPVGQTGHFAVRWPEGAGVTKLIATRLLRATEPSPLEAADELYAAGKFQEALNHYRDQSAASGTKEAGWEARYKQAVCLLELRQGDDAIALWQQIAAEAANKWTTLAEIQLWALALERNDVDGAEEILRRLELKFQGDALARLIPDDLRNKIIAMTNPIIDARANSNTFLLYRPKSLKQLIMARDSIRLMGINHNANSPLNYVLNDGLLFAKDYNGAAIHATELMNYAPTLYPLEIRALRHLGNNHRVLQKLEAYELQTISRFPGTSNVDPYFLLLKLRVLAALERWSEWDELAAAVVKTAAHEFEDALLYPDKNLSTGWRSSNINSYVAVRAMQGFRLEQLGRKDEAQLAWKDAARATSGTLDHIVSDFRLRHIVLTFSGLNTRELCERHLNQRDMANTSPQYKVLDQLVGRDALLPVLQEMWSTPRGRDAARQTIFDSLPFYENVSLAQRLTGYEYLRQSVFDRNFDSDQDQLVWSLALDLYDAAVREVIAGPQILSLGLVWKGTTGIFGWNTASASLPPPLRSKLAYVFAHRYRKLGRPNDAVKLFQAAIDAVPESLTAKLAARDLAMLKAAQ